MTCRLVLLSDKRLSFVLFCFRYFVAKQLHASSVCKGSYLLGSKAGFSVSKNVVVFFLVQRRKHLKRRGKKGNELLSLNLQMKGVNLIGRVKIMRVKEIVITACYIFFKFEKESVG